MFRLLPHRAFIEPSVSVASEQDGATARAVLRVDGLLCSACAANVRDRLERINGVSAATVNLDRGSAYIEFDPQRTNAVALVAAVESAVLLRPLRRLLASLRGLGRRIPVAP